MGLQGLIFRYSHHHYSKRWVSKPPAFDFSMARCSHPRRSFRKSPACFTRKSSPVAASFFPTLVPLADSPSMINSWPFALGNSPIGKVCATSSPASKPENPGSIIWASVVRLRAPIWLTLTDIATGVYFRRWPKCSCGGPHACTSKSPGPGSASDRFWAGFLDHFSEPEPFSLGLLRAFPAGGPQAAFNAVFTGKFARVGSHHRSAFSRYEDPR